MPLPPILDDLLTLPTAPFIEDVVLGYIEQTCELFENVTLKSDKWGNLLVHYRNKPTAKTPIVFTAHTDHPGFAALQMRRDGKLIAAFRGWVEPEYFLGTKVRFWSDGHWVKGKIAEILKAAPIYGMIGRTGRPEEVLIETAQPVAQGSPGMWELPDPVMKKDGRVYARGCDDIAGAAALLQMLANLSKRNARGEVYVLFTRAEEVGFVGAIGAAKANTISKKLPVIAIETSKAVLGVEIGGGPILRVGDKSSMFTPAVTAFADRIAKQLVEKDKSFAYQRKLMDGGTCESTAYIAYGYQAGGICVALGNYHNMDTKRKKIGSESISMADWTRMVQWFEAIATDGQGFGTEGDALRKSLDERFASYEKLL